MPKKLKRDTEKVTMRLFAGQKGSIESYYPNIGYSAVIRTLIDNHLNTLEAQMPEKQAIELDLEETTNE